MKVDEWEQVKTIVQEALEIEGEKRARFIAEKCGGDERVRREVESLLASHEDAGDFIETPAFAAKMRVLADKSEADDLTGRTLGHYEIVRRLGSGGMGAVYLAADLKLKREVAVKTLNFEFGSDVERVLRFKREAITVSKLNHPNILTIYEIGQTESGADFIVTEFVEGSNLRAMLKDSRLCLNESIDICEQAAKALAAAHASGIIHRDVKPENIMVRRDGLVKVLDFGIAKLSRAQNGFQSPESAGEESELITASGVIMGTLGYMSPEQARGLATDARSDIWSLGCVLYEMVTGRTPFDGATPTDRLVAIIHKNPPPLSELNKALPAQLEKIVGKCLAKNTEDRYRTMCDLLADLQSLKRKLESAEPFESAGQPETALPLNNRRAGNETLGKWDNTTQILNAVTSENEEQHSLSEKPNAPAARSSFVPAFAAVALLILTAVGFATYQFLPFKISSPDAKPPLPESSQSLKFTRLVSGELGETVISPDGKYAVYSVGIGGEKFSVRLREIATAAETELLPPAPDYYGGFSFSPGSEFIYYDNYKDFAYPHIFRIPVIGGSPVKIAEQSSQTAVSPDGKKIAFLREGNKDSSLLVANADGSDARTVLNLTEPLYVGFDLAWSPDGKTIACVINSIEQGDRVYKVFGVDAADGTRRELSPHGWRYIRNVVWLAGGELVVSAREKGTSGRSPMQLWRIAPGGEVRRLTNDFNGYNSVSGSADGSALLTTSYKDLTNVWTMPAGDAARAVQINSLTDAALVEWTPDGKLFCVSKDTFNIWLMNADGTNRTQLTHNQGSNNFPSMTRDGRHIVFTSDRAGTVNHIFRMNADGRDQRQLTSGMGEWLPRLSPDGRWIYYVAATPGNEPLNLCRISIEGGEPVVIAKFPTYTIFDVSPRDGAIAYVLEDIEQDQPNERIAIISPEGGEPLKIFDLPKTARTSSFLKWTPDGSRLTIGDFRGGSANVWTISPDGKNEMKPVTNFTSEKIFDFAWSADGKQLAVVRGISMTDAVLITENK